jgi:hypothetical protein
MPRLFLYRQMTDGGFAPHISQTGLLTLTICKPNIRKSAKPGDYIVALAGSSLKDIVGIENDKYKKVSYIYKVTETVAMKNYQEWCMIHAPNKIPSDPEFMGNCQYNASLQYMPGPHGPEHRNRNLSGCYSVVSGHFGAWTFANLHTLTDDEIHMLNLTEEEIQSVKRGHRVFALTPSREEGLETLMASAPQTEKSFIPNLEVGDVIEESESPENNAGSKTRKACKLKRKRMSRRR